MSQAEIENDAATLGQYSRRLTAPELSAGRRNDSESRRLETSQSASITVRCTKNFQIATTLRDHCSPSYPCLSMITDGKKLHQKS